MRAKPWIGFVLKGAVSVAILALIAAQTDLVEIQATLRSISVNAVFLALVLILVQTLVTAYRWGLVMQAAGVPLRFRPALGTLFVSLFLNQCLPSYVGGDAYRIYWVYQRGNRLGRSVRGVLIDRISAVIVLFVMMAVGLPLLFQRFDDPAARAGLLGLLACGVSGTAIFFASDLLPRSWHRSWMLAEWAELSSTARRVLLHGAQGWLIGCSALVVHGLSAAIMFVFAEELQLPLTLLDCLLLIPAVMLLSAIPISIAGWGVREGVLVGVLSTIGIGAEQALTLSVLLGFTLLANGLIGALPLAVSSEHSLRLRMGSLKPSGAEEAAG